MSAIRGIQCTVETGLSQMRSGGSGGHWWALTEAGSSPPQTASLLINTNDAACWEDGEKHARGSPSLGHVRRSFTSDCGIKLQLEFKISMRSVSLKRTAKLTIVVNKGHIWWPGRVCLAAYGMAELGRVRFVAT